MELPGLTMDEFHALVGRLYIGLAERDKLITELLEERTNAKAAEAVHEGEPQAEGAHQAEKE